MPIRLFPGASRASECVVCPNGTYLSSDACVVCPANSTTEGTGTPSKDGCACDKQFFALHGMCEAVPRGLDALALGSTVQSLVTRATYWRLAASSTVAKLCPYPQACVGGVVTEATYNRSSGETCASDLTGAYCTTCDDPDSQFFDPLAVRCKACDGVATAVAVLVVVIILVTVGLLWLLVQRLASGQKIAAKLVS